MICAQSALHTWSRHRATDRIRILIDLQLVRCSVHIHCSGAGNCLRISLFLLFVWHWSDYKLTVVKSSRLLVSFPEAGSVFGLHQTRDQIWEWTFIQSVRWKQNIRAGAGTSVLPSHLISPSISAPVSPRWFSSHAGAPPEPPSPPAASENTSQKLHHIKR